MLDYQGLALRWAADQHELTALLILLLGLGYLFQGFRLARILLSAFCGLLGYVGGMVVTEATQLPPTLTSVPLTASLALAAMVHYRVGLLLASVGTFAGLGFYVADRFHLAGMAALFLEIVGAAAGALFVVLSRRALPIVLTVVHGSGLLILGFVGLCSYLAPSLGQTFRDWAAAETMLVPILMTMLSVMGYSYQANLQQGDVRTGSRRILTGVGA